MTRHIIVRDPADVQDVPVELLARLARLVRTAWRVVASLAQRARAAVVFVALEARAILDTDTAYGAHAVRRTRITTGRGCRVRKRSPGARSAFNAGVCAAVFTNVARDTRPGGRVGGIACNANAGLRLGAWVTANRARGARTSSCIGNVASIAGARGLCCTLGRPRALRGAVRTCAHGLGILVRANGTFCACGLNLRLCFTIRSSFACAAGVFGFGKAP